MERNTRYDAYDVPVELIFADDDFNCRRRFTLDTLDELSASIADKGLEFPIVVQPAEEVGCCPSRYQYRLVAGFRRFKAISLLLNWRTIPAIIRTGLSEEDARLLNLTENLERKDLNKLEEAKALAALFDESLSSREIGRRVHRTTGWVQDRRHLLRMPQRIQDKVAAGMFTLADVRYVAKHDERQWGKIIAQCEQRNYRKKNPVLSKKRAVKNKSQMQDMLVKLRQEGVKGLPLMLMCWAIGEVDERHIWSKVEKHKEDDLPDPQGDLLD